MMKLFYIGLLLIATPVWAQSSMVFKRDILTIFPKEEPQIQKDGNAEATVPATPAREPIRFYTEIRPEQVLEMDWIMALSRISAKHTMTVLFNPPRYDMVQAQPISQPLDVLLVSPEGIIVQMMPELVLSQLAQPIAADRPIRARIILQGGAAESLGIIPGDRVEHDAFQPVPKVLR